LAVAAGLSVAGAGLVDAACTGLAVSAAAMVSAGAADFAASARVVFMSVNTPLVSK